MKVYLATLVTTAALVVSAPAFAQTLEVSPGGVTVHGRGHDEQVERRVIEERHAPPRVEHRPPAHRDVVIERREEPHPSREVVIERRRVEHHD